MSGKAQKHPADLKDARASRVRPMTVIDVTVNEDGELVAEDEHGDLVPVVVPDPPEDVGEYAQQVWRDFWLSPVAQLVKMTTHGEALRHWIRLVHQRTWLWETYRSQPLVKGSKDQPMTNPLWRQVRELNEEIARYEEQFGMTPLAQMRLGVEFLIGQHLGDSLRARRRGKPQPYLPGT